MAATAACLALVILGALPRASAQTPKPPLPPIPPPIPPTPPSPPSPPPPPPYSTPPGMFDVIVGGNSCPVCYTQYFMKNVASPSYMIPNSACARYENSACCSAEMAMNISTRAYNKVSYPGYEWDRCGKLSAACEEYFVQEACLYECDHNIGKFRKYRDTCTDPDGTQNAWQIQDLPLKASTCNAWYDACKNDYFCTDGSRDYFSTPDNACVAGTPECKKFSDIYANGTEICNVMWGGSFKYTTDESKAFSLTYTYGQPNPNDRIAAPTPKLCPYRPKFNATTECTYGIGNVSTDKVYINRIMNISAPPPPSVTPTTGAAATFRSAAAAISTAFVVAIFM